MKSIAQFSALLLLTLTITLSSCNRKGCTNADAINYESKAKKDCKCCEFQGSIVMWIDKNASDWLVQNNITSLTYYVDGELIATVPSNVYLNSAPSCGQSGAVTAVKNMGGHNVRGYLVSVKDSNGDLFFLDEVTFRANTCTTQLIE